jgi:hypothetical protein
LSSDFARLAREHACSFGVDARKAGVSAIRRRFWRAGWVAALVSILGCSLARDASADEPVRTESYDPGVYPPPSARWGLLAAGAGTTLVWYGGAVGFSYLWPDAPGANDLRVPIAGPWLALADTGCADDNPDCSTFTVVLRAILTAVDGIGQAGGLAVVGEALFLPTAAAPSSPAPRRQAALSVKPVPMLAGGGAVGFGLVGQF